MIAEWRECRELGAGGEAYRGSQDRNNASRARTLVGVCVRLAIALTLAGCTLPTREEAERGSSTPTPTRLVAPSTDLAGTLAYIGSDGNVWVTSPNQGWTQQVTFDATAAPEGQGRSYHRVAWSREGGLAYAAVTRTGDEARSELFLKPGLDKRAQLIARNEEHFVIYLYASPNACLGSPNCSSLGYLIEEANGVGLHLVSLRLDGAQSARDLLVAVGRPFYFSWSPNGDEIIWHTGGALRDDPSAELTLYNIEEDRRILLPFAPGNYQSPAWSPRDRAWLHVIDANGMEQLAHSTSEAATNLVSTAGHGAAFVWSPDGKSVAYASRPRPDAAFYGPISVLDMQSRESHRLTDDAFNVLGFFWSPDGSKLAYLSRLDLPDAIWMQWRVFDTVDGQDRGFTAFHPSPLMRFLVHSFDQYAQSHRFWSPDSRYLVYADRDDRGTDHVKLIDVGGMKDADPIVAADGSIGIWSWQ